MRKAVGFPHSRHAAARQPESMNMKGEPCESQRVTKIKALAPIFRGVSMDGTSSPNCENAHPRLRRFPNDLRLFSKQRACASGAPPRMKIMEFELFSKQPKAAKTLVESWILHADPSSTPVSPY